MTDLHFSDFSDLITAGFNGDGPVESVGLFNGNNVRFPAVVNGIDATVPDTGPNTRAVVKGGDGLGTSSAAWVNVFGGNAPGSGDGGSVDIKGGDSDSGQSGSVRIHAGTSTSGSQGATIIGDPTANYAQVDGNGAALIGTGSQIYISVDGGGIFIGGLLDFADDAAAAVGSLDVGRMYRTGSIIKVRVA